MNSEVTEKQPQEGIATKANRNGYLMLAAILVPMVAAYLVFKTGLGMPTGTINKGVLLTPATQLSDLRVTDPDLRPVQWSDLSAQWRFLVPIMQPCESDCDQALYITRQVHKRLNEKYPKVSRWVLIDASLWNDALAQKLSTDYQDSTVLLVNAEQWHSWLRNTNSDRALYYMVDNQGFAMMFYQQQHTGNDLLADIKRMLKLSREH